jgi:hypothetical protein
MRDRYPWHTVRSLSTSRATVVRTGVVFVAILASSGSVYAQSSTPAATDAPPGDAPPGAASLKRARDAWQNGDFDLAPGLYQNALKAGGLPHDDVLDAWIRIGSALAIGGKKKAAFAAFRNAALLDPGFHVPPEAGKKAQLVAEQARRAQVRVGSLTLGAKVNDEVDAQQPFEVAVTLAPAHAPMVDAVAFEARDATAGHAFQQASPAAAHLRFEVPARMATSDATLVVHVEARDVHNNQLAVAEKAVRVARAPQAATAPPALAGNAEAPAHQGPLSPLAPVPPLRRDERVASSGGFWHTAWPYIIGGAALAAGGAAAYYFTRPTDDVNVLGPRVEVH